MNTIRKNKLNIVAVFLLLLACLFSMTGFSAKAAGNTSIWLPVKQTFESSEKALSGDQQAFEYSLVPLETGNPMPEGSSENEYALTLTGNQETTIQIDYSNTGVYSYHFRQVIDEAKDGYTYDEEQYTITVYVKHNTRGELISEVSVAKQTNGMKVAALEFENRYAPWDSARTPSQDEPDGDGDEPDAAAADANGAAAVDNASVDQQGGDGAQGAEELQEAEGEDLEQLDSDAVPRGLRNTDAWALWNLIFAALTVLGSVILLITYLRKRTESEDGDAQEDQESRSVENEEEEDAKKKRLCRPARVFSLIVSIASVIFFILTEDVTLPMRWADQYTWIMVVIFLVQIVDMLFIRVRGKKKEEKN